MDARPAQAHLNMETVHLDMVAGSDFPEPTRKTSATKPSDERQGPQPSPGTQPQALGTLTIFAEGEDVVLHVLLAVEAHPPSRPPPAAPRCCSCPAWRVALRSVSPSRSPTRPSRLGRSPRPKAGTRTRRDGSSNPCKELSP